jgi:hypothetical protein
VSSQAYSHAAAIALCAVALTGCGSDSEPSTEVAERVTTPTTPMTSSTTSTAAEQAAQRRAARRAAARRAAKERRERKARAARRERRRKAQQEAATATATAPAPTPEPDPPAQPKPKPKPAGPTVHHIVEQATLKLVEKQGINFIQQGTVTGTVAGTMRLDAKLGGEGVVGTFVMTTDDGTLSGQASAKLALKGSFANFNGTATIATGTGAFADVVRAQLAFSGRVAADASTSVVKLAGDLRY